MTEADDQELALLSRARKALSPSAGDGPRVRAALDVALASGAVASVLSPSQAGVGRVLRRLVLPALIAAGGAVGYGLGHHAGFTEGRDAARTEFPPSESVTTKAAVPESIEPRAHEPLQPAASSQQPARVGRSAVPPANGAPPEAGLDEEVRSLRRVERALREGNPRYALALLDDLDRQVPHGQLVEERQAALVMARCQLGMGGIALGQDFERQHPGSAYARRVEETCAGKDSQTEP